MSFGGGLALHPELSSMWLQVAKRLQMLAKTKHIEHCKVIKLTVLVDTNGTPIAWADPECMLLSPSGDGVKDWLSKL